MWGGRTLARVAHKSLPPDVKIGETWDVWHGSVITNGQHRGQSLDALVRRAGRADGQFPLLFKYIDAHDHLSVQVHPDDQSAQMMEQHPFGKTEAWYILHAEPDAVVVHGFQHDVTVDDVRDGLARNTITDLLAMVPVRTGDVLFVPAGLVHAIGKGIVLAEIQQHSDITYRLYDWDRTDDTNRPRELHVDKALRVSDLRGLRQHTVPPLVVAHAQCEQHFLVACRYFVLERLVVTERCAEFTLGDAAHIVSVLSGEAQFTFGPSFAWSVVAQMGQTILLPAQLGRYGIVALVGPCHVLRAYVPSLRRDVIDPLRQAGYDAASIVRLGGPIATHNDLIALV